MPSHSQARRKYVLGVFFISPIYLDIFQAYPQKKLLHELIMSVVNIPNVSFEFMNSTLIAIHDLFKKGMNKKYAAWYF